MAAPTPTPALAPVERVCGEDSWSVEVERDVGVSVGGDVMSGVVLVNNVEGPVVVGLAVGEKADGTLAIEFEPESPTLEAERIAEVEAGLSIQLLAAASKQY